MTEVEEHKKPVTQIFAQMMEENPNQPEIKAIIHGYTEIIQTQLYHGLTSTQQQYLQACGLIRHEEQHFNYINQLLHSRTTEFLQKISENQIQVKSTLPPPPPPPPQVSKEIIQEVEEVMRNIDLPLSLFKRQDNYWSHDNAKTMQVKEYIKKLHEQDRKWKGDLKRKRQEILNQKNEMYHKNNEEVMRQQQKAKQDEKSRMAKKIEQLKSQPDSRKKTIQEGLQFIKKQGRPLFKKMEQQFVNKVQMPTLEQKKRKLSEIRSLRKSVDLNQIQQHRQKYQKIKEEHQAVKIHNEAVKVSYKGAYHKSLQKSHLDDIMGESGIKNLVDRKIEYSRVVKERYRPSIDSQKASQIAQRIEGMNKRFTRAKRNKIRSKEGEDEDEDEQEEEEPEPQPQPEEEDEQEEQQDDEDGIKVPKDDQYEPSNKERYKMGLKFLEQARRRRKKVGTAKPQGSNKAQDSRNKTFSVKQVKISESNQFSSINVSIANQDLVLDQRDRKIKYRNYLQEMSKVNKTIDHIDTSRIKKEFTGDMKLKSPLKLEEVENKIRSVEQKAKNQQELLKYGRQKKGESLGKKQQLDNVILDTIKARLALMKN